MRPRLAPKDIKSNIAGDLARRELHPTKKTAVFKRHEVKETKWGWQHYLTAGLALTAGFVPAAAAIAPPRVRTLPQFTNCSWSVSQGDNLYLRRCELVETPITSFCKPFPVPATWQTPAYDIHFNTIPVGYVGPGGSNGYSPQPSIYACTPDGTKVKPYPSTAPNLPTVALSPDFLHRSETSMFRPLPPIVSAESFSEMCEEVREKCEDRPTPRHTTIPDYRNCERIVVDGRDIFNCETYDAQLTEFCPVTKVPESEFAPAYEARFRTLGRVISDTYPEEKISRRQVGWWTCTPDGAQRIASSTTGAGVVGVALVPDELNRSTFDNLIRPRPGPSINFEEFSEICKDVNDACAPPVITTTPPVIFTTKATKE